MSGELRQFSLAVGIVFLSFILVLGSMLVSFSEGGRLAALFPSPTSTLLPSFTPAPTEEVTLSGLGFTPTPTSFLTQTFTPSPTWTIVSPCQYPENWVPITVQPGDTLETLAATYQTSIDQLEKGNCLSSSQLISGEVLYVPRLTPTLTFTQSPTATRRPVTPTPCPPPPLGWVPYVVQFSDTLYSIAQKFGVALAQLEAVNCISNPNLINVGMTIYVPYRPTSTWTPTMTPSATPSPTITDTPTATELPTDTPTPTDTDTPEPTPTDTPSPYPGP